MFAVITIHTFIPSWFH